MTTDFHSAEIYPHFLDDMDKVAKWLHTQNLSTKHYDSDALVKRIIQRVAEVTLVPYVERNAGRVKNQNPLTPNSKFIKLEGIKLNTKTGVFKINVSYFLKSILEFHLHWLHALSQVIIGLIKNSKQLGSASIVFGIGIENILVGGADLRFIEYCRLGPIDPLRDSKRLIIQALTKTQSKNADYLAYSRLPLFALMLSNPLKLSAFMKFLRVHLKVLFDYWLSVIKFPVLSLLGRDFAYHSIAADLNDRNLIDSVVITNSNYSAQPLWMISLPKRNFRTHMVWYAQNTIPIIYKDSPIKASIPNYYYMQVDTHWVWTKGYAEYLISIGVKSEIKVVGPIVWHLAAENKQLKNQANEIMIAVFDVTPVTNEFAEEIGLYGNYYSASNMLDFIKKIKRLKLELALNTTTKIRILLKHKRYHTRFHDEEYISYITKLLNEKSIELVDAQVNIFSLIESADLVVVVPYSSPAYVADSLAIPAIFFDATETVLPDFEKTNCVNFASGYEQLISSSRKILHERLL